MPVSMSTGRNNEEHSNYTTRRSASQSNYCKATENNGPKHEPGRITASRQSGSLECVSMSRNAIYLPHFSHLSAPRNKHPTAQPNTYKSNGKTNRHEPGRTTANRQSGSLECASMSLNAIYLPHFSHLSVREPQMNSCSYCSLAITGK